jgi:hypothetical protein
VISKQIKRGVEDAGPDVGIVIAAHGFIVLV